MKGISWLQLKQALKWLILSKLRLSPQLCLTGDILWPVADNHWFDRQPTTHLIINRTFNHQSHKICYQISRSIFNILVTFRQLDANNLNRYCYDLLTTDKINIMNIKLLIWPNRHIIIPYCTKSFDFSFRQMFTGPINCGRKF